jgi:geranylgeranyl reductase family protein
VRTFDAVIVGAGPAGASAAHVLASGGAKVLLIEKARMPRYKPCGGGLSSRVLSTSPIAARYMPEIRTASIRLTADQHAADCALPTDIHMVMRDQFDAYLVEQAIAAGAEFRDGQAVTALETEGPGLAVQTGAECVRGQYVIGADGANGVVARLAGFPPVLLSAAAIEVEVAASDDVLARYGASALFDFGAVPGGYGWVFGKRDGLSCGIGVFDLTAARMLRPALTHFLAGVPGLHTSRVLRQRGHRIPIAGGRKTRIKGRVLLAGDAAALADPLTGEGIPYALRSGSRAAATVLTALASGPEVLGSYDRFLTHGLGADLRYARLLAAITYRWPSLLVRLVAEHHAFRDMAAAAVIGQLSYRQLAAALARRSPKLLRYAL